MLRIIAVSFFALAIYVTVESALALLGAWVVDTLRTNASSAVMVLASRHRAWRVTTKRRQEMTAEGNK